MISLPVNATDVQEQGLRNHDLRDELMTLLVAGHGTKATALTAALNWLHRTPEALNTLRKELETVPSATGSGRAAGSALPRSSLAGSPADPPGGHAHLPRQVEAPVLCGGHQCKACNLVLGCIRQLHQREDLYPTPASFPPERFLKRQFCPYELLPFRGGVRHCVGTALAQYELKIVLGSLLRHFRLAPAVPRPVGQARRDHHPGPCQAGAPAADRRTEGH